MTYSIRIDPIAQRQIDEFAVYLSGYDEKFAVDQLERLDQSIALQLGESPLTWGYFAFTGAPYRAYLFRVGRRTQYWIVYTVDEESRRVDILQFWNAARKPDALPL